MCLLTHNLQPNNQAVYCNAHIYQHGWPCSTETHTATLSNTPKMLVFIQSLPHQKFEPDWSTSRVTAVSAPRGRRVSEETESSSSEHLKIAHFPVIKFCYYHNSLTLLLWGTTDCSDNGRLSTQSSASASTALRFVYHHTVQVCSTHTGMTPRAWVPCDDATVSEVVEKKTHTLLSPN